MSVKKKNYLQQQRETKSNKKIYICRGFYLIREWEEKKSKYLSARKKKAQVFSTYGLKLWTAVFVVAYLYLFTQL